MCGLFKKKKKKSVFLFPSPREVPKKFDPFGEAAAEQERRRLSGLYGRRSTILTGGGGVSSLAPVQHPMASDR